MTKCLKIDNCYGCPHYDHSGSFTPGGAIPLCGASQNKQYKYNRRELPYEFDKDTGKRRMIAKIPHWCPLPNC